MPAALGAGLGDWAGRVLKDDSAGSNRLVAGTGEAGAALMAAALASGGVWEGIHRCWCCCLWCRAIEASCTTKAGIA